MTNWSSNQLAIFEAALDPSASHMLVRAVAGSGKTSTLVELANRLPSNSEVIVLAFNKNIAEELQTRMPSWVKASTFHSLCYRALLRSLPAKPEVDKFKVTRLAKKIIPEADHEHYLQYVKRLVAYAKNAGVGYAHLPYPPNTPEAYRELAENHNLFPDTLKSDPAVGWNYAVKVLEASNAEAGTAIDYDDMIYLAFLKGSRLPTPQYILVDELQDFNGVQHELVRRMIGKNTRFIGVGDPRQSIYGFRGAVADSMQRLHRNLQATWYPLDISYRCSKAVVRAAQEFCPEIRAADTAPEGSFAPDELCNWTPELFKENDAILCRTMKPLLQLAGDFIRAVKPCQVMGRDIGDNIIKQLQALCPPELSLSEGITAVRTFFHERIVASIEIGNEGQADFLIDQRDSMITILETAGSCAKAVTIVQQLFSSKSGPVLSTVHRAKGLEFENVYVLMRYDLMPWPKAETVAEIEQENNLIYVAYTRAKKNLYMLGLRREAEEADDIMDQPVTEDEHSDMINKHKRVFRYSSKH